MVLKKLKIHRPIYIWKKFIWSYYSFVQNVKFGGIPSICFEDLNIRDLIGQLVKSHWHTTTWTSPLKIIRPTSLVMRTMGNLNMKVNIFLFVGFYFKCMKYSPVQFCPRPHMVKRQSKQKWVSESLLHVAHFYQGHISLSLQKK